MKLVGVRFLRADNPHLFDPGGLDLAVGEKVVVKTSKGLELGVVVFIGEGSVDKGLRRVIRRASQADEQRARELEGEGERYLMEACDEASRSGLPIKLIRARFTLDGRRLIFDFSAKGRVNLREFARLLSRRFRCRVEFNRVGPRDEVKIIGGLGVCGLKACCCSWLYEFKSVSLKMAAQQGLIPNPERMTGPCGRLLCCLSFELENYIKAKEEADLAKKS